MIKNHHHNRIKEDKSRDKNGFFKTGKKNNSIFRVTFFVFMELKGKALSSSTYLLIFLRNEQFFFKNSIGIMCRVLTNECQFRPRLLPIKTNFGKSIRIFSMMNCYPERL